MTRFKKDSSGRLLWWLIKDGKEYRLTKYTPRNNEFEKGLKYILWERWYDGSLLGDYRNTLICKVSSIKEAENIIRGL